MIDAKEASKAIEMILDDIGEDEKPNWVDPVAMAVVILEGIMGELYRLRKLKEYDIVIAEIQAGIDVTEKGQSFDEIYAADE